MLRFTDDDFDAEQALTIGVDFKTKVVNIDGVNVKLGECDRHSTAIDLYCPINLVCSHLGHGRPGEIPHINTELLQVRPGSSSIELELQ